MATLIVGAEELRKKVRGFGPEILREIGPTIAMEAVDIRNTAQMTVPRGETNELASSAFVDGVEIDDRTLSATATAGYEAEHAAYAHEGYHYGRKLAVPPKWLEHAADGREHAFAQVIGDAIREALPKIVGP